MGKELGQENVTLVLWISASKSPSQHVQWSGVLEITVLQYSGMQS